MKLNLLLIIVIVLGCNEVNKPSSGKKGFNQRESPNNKFETNISDTKTSIEIENNEFANSPLGSYNFNTKDLATYFKGHYDLRYEITRNKYEDLIDTLILFRRNNSVVRFYKTKGKTFLDSLFINERNFVVVHPNIDIGMSKQNFNEVFDLGSVYFPDSVIVSNDEANSRFYILFKNDKIVTMSQMPW